MFAPIGQALAQLAQQAGQLMLQELSKPHYQAHLVKMIREAIKDKKKKK